MDESDLFTGFSGENSEDRDLDTGSFFNPVQSCKSGDRGPLWPDPVLVTGPGFSGGSIEHMLPLKIVRRGDDTAAAFPALSEGGLCARGFHPGIHQGRGRAGKAEAPYHRKDSSANIST